MHDRGRGAGRPKRNNTQSVGVLAKREHAAIRDGAQTINSRGRCVTIGTRQNPKINRWGIVHSTKSKFLQMSCRYRWLPKGIISPIYYNIHVDHLFQINQPSQQTCTVWTEQRVCPTDCTNGNSNKEGTRQWFQQHQFSKENDHSRYWGDEEVQGLQQEVRASTPDNAGFDKAGVT